MCLAELCRIQMGYSAKASLEADSDGIPVIQLRDAPQVGRLKNSSPDRYKIDGKIERYYVGAGDMLFRSRGDRSVVFVLGEDWKEPVVAAYPFMILRQDITLIAPAYLVWSINQPPAQRFFEREKQGATIMAINRKSLADVPVSVPDLPTQEAIGELAELQKQENDLLHRLAEMRSRMNVSLLLGIATQNSRMNRRGVPQ